MNRIKIVFQTVFSIAFLFVLNVSNGQQTIEGIHYATGKPVQVKIKDGKIDEIKELKKLKKNGKVY